MKSECCLVLSNCKTAMYIILGYLMKLWNGIFQTTEYTAEKW